MSSVAIQNTSIEPASLPYPFSGVLGGLGSSIFTGTAAEALAIVPTLREGFRVTDMPTAVPGAPALPGFPGQDTDKAVDIVVGNELNGATIAGCTYLDPGDGTGIITAMEYAIANPSKQFVVKVGPGVYTLTEDAPLITVPSNVIMIGAGIGRTHIVGTSIADVVMTILSVDDDAVLQDFSWEAPENLAIDVPSDYLGIVELTGIGQKFYRVKGTINVSATLATYYIPYHYNAAASPGGTEFHDCEAIYVGDTSTGLPFGGRGWSIASSGTVTPNMKPQRFVRCRFACDGGLTGSSMFAFKTDPNVSIEDCYVRNGSGLAVSTTSTTTATPGPMVNGLTVDSRGITNAQPVNGVALTLAGSSTYRDIMINNLRMLANGTADANSRTFYCRVNDTAGIYGMYVNGRGFAQAADGSGGMEIYLAGVAGIVDADIHLAMPTADAVVTTTSTATLTDARLAISGGAVTLGAKCVNVDLLDACQCSGALTIAAGATGTSIGKMATFASIADSTTGAQGTKYGNGKTRTITGDTTMVFADDTILANLGAAAALTLPSAALSKGKRFCVRDIGGNFSTRNCTLTPASGTINGGASLALATDNGTTYFMSDGTNWFTLGKNLAA